MAPEQPKSEMQPMDGETFLSRWSRRKRTGDDTAPVQPKTDAPGRTEKDAAAAQIPATGEPVIDLSKLPKLEDFTASTDITAFLQKGIPDELKRLALRKAWSLDPQIRDFVEVAENQYDWNTPGGAPGYGDLDPGSNLQALLAQATGQSDPTDVVAAGPGGAAPDGPSATKVSSSHVAVPSDEHPSGRGGGIDRDAGACERADTPTSADTASDETDRSFAPAVQIATPTPPSTPEHPADPAGPRRKRHGGALPEGY